MSSLEMARLREFRAGWHDCLTRRGNALFELTDAVLCAPTITSLPYLSLEPVFRRSWGSLYDGLAAGSIDAGRVRELLVRSGPADWPLTFAVDASTHPRPYAETSPGREWHHLSGPGGVDGGVPGWAWQHVTQLNLDHDSWVAPMDVTRVATGGPAQTLAAVGQIRAMADRLRTAGRAGRKLFVHDAGYGPPLPNMSPAAR
ncbi:transposase [Nonomuraea turcica]|uniref:transposase n=1 Tax=Nonomuraea sp. G32 TaxID=3067274 RepID=UPI00273BCF5C|nr:transposase [Nonomuraea sp. G32]MDP4510378.1 transposase [Nonomuraea sp. G32]